VIMLLAHGSPAVARGISLLHLFGYVGLFLSPVFSSGSGRGAAGLT